MSGERDPGDLLGLLMTVMEGFKNRLDSLETVVYGDGDPSPVVFTGEPGVEVLDEVSYGVDTDGTVDPRNEVLHLSGRGARDC